MSGAHTKGLIVTDHIYPPIPVRQFDWCAWLDGQEEEGPRGWGETKEQAIDALLDELCADRCLTSAEQKAQGSRCGCGGADDYCGCQNVPDETTLREWRAAFAKAEGLGQRADAPPEHHRGAHLMPPISERDREGGLVAAFDNDAFTVEAGSFSLALTVRQIERNWDALSHFPDRRARGELRELAERLNGFAEHVAAIVAKGGSLDVATEFERFASRHVTLTRRAWAMDSRCMSWFVVGPARFPVDRNRKKMDWADNAYSAIRDHAAAARKAVERIAFPQGLPGGPIRADNPDAPDLLRTEIQRHRDAHSQMKAANAAIRSVKGGDVEAMVQAVVDATGWRESTARKCVVPAQAWMGRGFAAYSLSGELAEIKRLEIRLANIERNRERGTVERTHNTTAGALRVVENGEAARIQLFFDGKPEASTRDLLKREGFRWAPSEGAWQRHLNNGGRYAVSRVVSALQMEAA